MASEMKVRSDQRSHVVRTEEPPPPRSQMERELVPQAIFARSKEEQALRLQLMQAKGDGLKDRLAAASNGEKIKELEKKLQQEASEKDELMQRFLKNLTGKVELEEQNRTAQFNVGDLKTDMENLQEKLKASDARIQVLNEQLEECRIYREQAAELHTLSKEVLYSEIGALENVIYHGSTEKTAIWAGSWFGPLGAAVAGFIPMLSPYNPFRDTIAKEATYRSALLKRRDELLAQNPSLRNEEVPTEAVSPYLTHIRSLFGIR